MLIQKVSADRLNPAAYNPRRDLKPGDKDYEKLKRSIEEFGFVEPVVWNRRTGFVVGGHQRLKVLLDAPDKSSGKRLQEIEIIYNHIGVFDHSKVTLWKGKAV